MANQARIGRLALTGLMAGTALGLGGCVIVVGGRGGHWDDNYVVEYRDEGRSRPTIGVTTSGLSESLATQLQINRKHATLITGVLGDRPAERVGMQKWDVVVGLNGDDDASPDRFRRAIRNTDEGDTIVLEVRRGGETLEIEIEPAIRRRR